jgi:hypothetical protein
VGVVGWLCGAVVGLALLVSGAAKIADRPRWREQAAGMRAPAWAVPALPWVELVVGAALVTRLATPWAAVAAAALLVAFTGLITLNLLDGRHPPCACFGQLSVKPLAWSAVGRNAVLFVLAALAGTLSG